MKKNNIIKIVLAVIIIFLAYEVYDSIMRPVRFNKEMRVRGNQVIQKLKDIRSSEFAYKSINRKYTGSFDTLIDFIKKDSIPVIKMVPDPNDTTFTITIRDTIGRVNVFDSLFKNRESYNINQLSIIPYSAGEKFDLHTGQIERSKMKMWVFEVKAHDTTFLKGLNKQMIINNIESKKEMDKYPGLKVGSLIDASTNGNWE